MAKKATKDVDEQVQVMPHTVSSWVVELPATDVKHITMHDTPWSL